MDLAAKMLNLQQYGSSDDENSEEDITSHMIPLGPGKSITALQNRLRVCSAPTVVPTVSLGRS